MLVSSTCPHTRCIQVTSRLNANRGALEEPLLAGWKRKGDVSLPESFSTVKYDAKAPWWKRLFSFVGIGFLISVGYSDPGNWVSGACGMCMHVLACMYANLVSIRACMRARVYVRAYHAACLQPCQPNMQA